MMLLITLFTCLAVSAAKIIEPRFSPNTLELLHVSGKNRMYLFGQTLREKYSSFINEMYAPEILYTTASHYPRCRSSLALVLAGLFPVEDSHRWNPTVSWEPIAYDYIPEDRNVMFSPWTTCRNFLNVFNKYLQGKQFGDLYPGFVDVSTYLRTNSGANYENLANLTTTIYSVLKAEDDLGLALPEWTKTVYPQPLEDLAGIGWRHYVGDDDLKTLGAGLLMKQILKNTEAKINGNATERKLKICLYSGHDYTVVAVLRLLDMYDDRMPNYGSSVTIEVHNYHGDRYVRVIEQNDFSSPNIREIPIPSCGRVCPLRIFQDLSAKYLNDDRRKALCG